MPAEHKKTARPTILISAFAFAWDPQWDNNSRRATTTILSRSCRQSVLAPCRLLLYFQDLCAIIVSAGFADAVGQLYVVALRALYQRRAWNRTPCRASRVSSRFRSPSLRYSHLSRTSLNKI